MIETIAFLIGDDAPLLRRYLRLALAYGALCGLTLAGVAPVLARLLAGDTGGAGLWLAVLLAGALGCWLLRRVVEEAGIRVGTALLKGARHRIGDHVARLPVGWFTPENTTELSHLVTHGILQLSQLPAHVVTPAVSGVATAIVLGAVLLSLHGPLGLIALGALPVIALVFLATARLGQRADRAFHRRSAQTGQRIVEFALAQSVLRAFGGEGGGRFVARAVDLQGDASAALIRLSALSGLLNIWVIQVVFAALLLSTVAWLAAAPGGGAVLGEIAPAIVALVLVSRFTDPLMEIVGYNDAFRGARTQLDTLQRLLSVRPLPEPDVSETPRDASVDLRHVSFRYEAGQREAVRDVTLRIEPGSMTAIVGASGSGKTTLVRLIARAFDADSGEVRIGGVDVRRMTSGCLAGQISQIFQSTYLFQGSIADNIRLGRPDATDQEVEAAARAAGVTAITDRLRDGLDAWVGEGGARLSGGERQRITIARAFLRDAPILLVDEATAALDAQNQAIIAEAIAGFRGTRTLIVIAHQLSTVAMADQIVVLDDGAIVEQGTPAQLRDDRGVYARFL
ncbi:MAG: ABC transporter ATP-binding protein, partial [Hansschlegelia sp.]